MMIAGLSSQFNGLGDVKALTMNSTGAVYLGVRAPRLDRNVQPKAVQCCHSTSKTSLQQLLMEAQLNPGSGVMAAVASDHLLGLGAGSSSAQ